MINFLFVTYFTAYNRLWIHLPHFNWLRFIPFYDWVIFHCVYIPQLLYLFICWWMSILLPCLGIVNSAAVNIGVCISFWIVVFSEYIPGSGIAGSCDSFIPSFLRLLHTVLLSSFISWHSHQWCKRVSFSLLPLQHLLFVSFLMMVILTDVRWYL